MDPKQKEKVAEKTSFEIRENVKEGKDATEIEKEMNPHNVSYKIKDETGQSK